MEVLVAAAYSALLALLSLFALQRLRLAWAARSWSRTEAKALPLCAEPPAVLVQLPVYNEPLVVERLIDAVCVLDYANHKLTIQVLDDSTDATTALALARVRYWQGQGKAIELVRRVERQGFKAGALAAGLAQSSAPFVAIFDADFVPSPDFLQRLMGHFADPLVGMVQARWTHLNRHASWLTEAQGILLDAHFINEHGGRFTRGCFFNFNGTAGIWRRQCIEAAGGWSFATLTEDLDLSYRALLAGWRFVYRPDVCVPAELPNGVAAFKIQQHRWAKGSIETAKLHMGRLWRAPLRMEQKLEAAFHLLGNAAYPLVLLLALLMPWVSMLRSTGTMRGLMALLDGILVLGSTGALLAAYGLALAASKARRRSFWHFPAVLALGVGLAVNNSRALWQAARGQRSEFCRTPKAGSGGALLGMGRSPPGYAQALVELGLGIYVGFGCLIAWLSGRYAAVPFLALFAWGFLWLGMGVLAPVFARFAGFGGLIRPLSRRQSSPRHHLNVDTPSLGEDNQTTAPGNSVA